MTQQSEPGQAPELPPVLEAAWGLRERPARGPKPGLSLDKIVAAGIALASREGLAAVSMARVAAELGASTMALYRYVRSKDELVTLMVDTAFGPPPPLPESADYWRPRLAHWAWSQRAAEEAQIWAIQVPISGPPSTPRQVAWMEQGLACLRGTGLDETQKMSVILLVSGYVRTQVLMESQVVAAIRAAGTTDQQAMADYNQILATLVDPQQYPEVTAVVESGVMGKADDMAEEFEWGLARILDGVGVLVDSLAEAREPGG